VGNETSKRNRRDFLAEAGIAAAAVAAVAGPSRAVAAGETKPPSINALLPTPEQMQAFLRLPDETPVVIVNLLKFKPNGEAEYAKYAAGVEPILKKLGGKILFAGKAQFCLVGHADWDMVALVQYPRKKALIQMINSPEYRAIHHHREAGLQGQVNYAVVAVEAEAIGGGKQPGEAKK
jgi:uncharacterized protein (DUF1330 family)